MISVYYTFALGSPLSNPHCTKELYERLYFSVLLNSSATFSSSAAFGGDNQTQSILGPATPRASAGVVGPSREEWNHDGRAARPLHDHTPHPSSWTELRRMRQMGVHHVVFYYEVFENDGPRSEHITWWKLNLQIIIFSLNLINYTPKIR